MSDVFILKNGEYVLVDEDYQQCYNTDVDWVLPNRDNKTKQEAPYSYDPFYIWRDSTAGSYAIYSDRLAQNDLEKYRMAVQKAAPDKRFEYYTRAEASKFMSAYTGKKIQVTALAEGCNVSNGYPYWIFWCKEVK